MTPFVRLSIQLCLFCMPHLDLIDPLFLQKNGLSLSHLVGKMLGTKLGLIFYQNVLFNSF